MNEYHYIYFFSTKIRLHVYHLSWPQKSLILIAIQLSLTKTTILQNNFCHEFYSICRLVKPRKLLANVTNHSNRVDCCYDHSHRLLHKQFVTKLKQKSPNFSSCPACCMCWLRFYSGCDVTRKLRKFQRHSALPHWDILDRYYFSVFSAHGLK